MGETVTLFVRDFPADLNGWLGDQARTAGISKQAALVAVVKAARARGDVVAVGAGPKPQEDR